ncbi:hypothetical protein D0C36_20705 [Mucilaginibacter conchicola]|uniref:Uncharacterized protein n=1 Tax=Mucilaginibacter conchicola TaxID=2303333 RepID=A0A372NMN8_9SPHI|nr:hypothetical protein D0C36_20705 [Mucilaginibacter conchicola]
MGSARKDAFRNKYTKLTIPCIDRMNVHESMRGPIESLIHHTDNRRSDRLQMITLYTDQLLFLVKAVVVDIALSMQVNHPSG